jgi:hypothetical protein
MASIAIFPPECPSFACFANVEAMYQEEKPPVSARSPDLNLVRSPIPPESLKKSAP